MKVPGVRIPALPPFIMKKNILFENTGGICQCIACVRKKFEDGKLTYLEVHDPMHFRYACEICGNKRCPHHTNHVLDCTNSNEPGQKGSVYQ